MKIIDLSSMGRKREYSLVMILFVAISLFFLFGLITSSGEIAQSDWVIPLTSNAAIHDFSSHLFVLSYGGFGEVNIGWGFPFFQFLNAVLAPFGFIGGVEIKILTVLLVSLGGVTAYILGRTFRLSKASSFLSGLFFMTTPIVFNWLIFGWIYYLIAYDLFPLMILATKKFTETNDFRYALINGLILSIATIQPTFILIYPLLGFLFILFEFKIIFKTIKRGLTLTAISLSIWFLTNLSFFTSYNNAETLRFYYSGYFEVINAQFSNFSSLINPIRLWGSTFNFQFETYFPKELIMLSFIPIVIAAVALLLKPNNRRVIFFSFSYLFVFLAYFVFQNMHYLVFNFPYGAVFEAPSIFLVPASLGLAILIGYTSQVIPRLLVKLKKLSSPRLSKKVSFAIILILIVLAGTPWWTEQISGNPIRGIPHKLNLYQIPADITTWTDNLNVSQDYFVLYLPLVRDAQIVNSTYFSEEYEGVNGGIFTLVNNLPYVSLSNSTLFLNELMNTTSDVGEHWGTLSVKYIAVYTHVYSAYTMSDILNRLSAQNGIVKVANFSDIVIFDNLFAKPVVYANNNSEAKVQIIYHNPTSFTVQASSNGPFTLVLNQIYSTGWRAWINGSVLPDATHFKDSNGFNSWQIDHTGTMTIDLYYEPQTIYIISKIITIGVLVVVLLFLLFASVGNFRHKLKN